MTTEDEKKIGCTLVPSLVVSPGCLAYFQSYPEPLPVCSRYTTDPHTVYAESGPHTLSFSARAPKNTKLYQ